MGSDRADDVIDRLVAWASGEALVRAVLLTSSRADPGAQLDEFSDYDVVLVVSDREPFDASDAWLRWYGETLVLFRNEFERGGVEYDMCLVLYRDGTKVDYCIWRPQDLRRVAAQKRPADLDLGYRVLLDKDALAEDLPPPTRTAFIPPKPSQREFELLVEEFWWETTYVAKNLRRGELLPAKYSFDAVMKFDVLRTMLEWRAEIGHGWSVNVGAKGRRLQSLLPPDLWRDVEATFVGADPRENWRALFATADVFRTAALAVAESLALGYPHAVDERVSAYLRSLCPQEFADDR